jgi:hypothetical protein
MFMTDNTRLHYSPPMMRGWQQTGAFVIQFRPETDIEAGRFEGRVEHVSSCKVARFHSLEELLGFMSSVLAEASNPGDCNHSPAE